MHNRYSKEWSKEGILNAMRRWNKLYGEGPFIKDWSVITGDHPSVWLVRQHFPSWRDAVEEAGIECRGRGAISHKLYVWEKITTCRGEHSYVR
jgi:hypothetical protein